jgi:hypothetical protein
MKRLVLILGCFLCQYVVNAQSVSLRDITAMLDLNTPKLEAHLQKKGYRRTYTFTNGERPLLSFIRQEHKEKDTILRSFTLEAQAKYTGIEYETSSAEEYNELTEQLKQEGFASTQQRAEPTFFQKQNITIETGRRSSEDVQLYTLHIKKASLPHAKDVHFAEDLLGITSQQYLIQVFGKENVKEDVFYFSEKETNKCSVIFPNTRYEAIFVWNDEQNLKDISFIVIGGRLGAKEQTDGVNQVMHNGWASKQGIYCGMGLQEVQQLNKSAVRFYNWRTDQAGYTTKENKGVIDFNKIGIVFNCLNCNYVPVGNEKVVASQQALDAEQKVFVTTFLVLPEKNRQAAVLTRN